ncbi:MAG TPA: hypothetical protein DDY82_03920 [Clostridiales bacterium]|nr:hypothetical protein [Clostridiales bacterium]
MQGRTVTPHSFKPCKKLSAHFAELIIIKIIAIIKIIGKIFFKIFFIVYFIFSNGKKYCFLIFYCLKKLKFIKGRNFT